MRTPLALLCCALLFTASAAGAATFSIAYWNGGAYIPGPSASTPLVDSRSYGLAPSGGSGTFTGSAYVGPGYVNSIGRTDAVWSSGGGFSGRIDAHAYADDCIITGPAVPDHVTATLHVRVRVNLTHTGGYPDNNGHGASIEVAISTPFMGTISDLISGNHSTYGTGLFSAITAPFVDMVLPLTGSFAVNVPFQLSMASYASGYSYGNQDYSPAVSQCDAGGPYNPVGKGVFLENVAGQVLTLPAGYTFSIPSWGLFNNTFTGPAGVDDAALPAALAFRAVPGGAHGGVSRFALSLPHEGHVSVVVYDLSGRVVRTLLDEQVAAGTRDVVWDGRDAAGVVKATGIYFVSARAEGRRLTVRTTQLY